MNSDTLNLLPLERQRLLVRRYRFRLAIVATFLGVLLVAIAGAMLFPGISYLQGIETSSSSIGERAVTNSDPVQTEARVAALRSGLEALRASASARSATRLVEDMLSVSRPGVRLSMLSYTEAVGSAPSALVVSGIATTRETLHAYELALRAASFAAKVELPVSSYAKETMIPFTLTVTLKS